jgi:hypothetical protein
MPRIFLSWLMALAVVAFVATPGMAQQSTAPAQLPGRIIVAKVTGDVTATDPATSIRRSLTATSQVSEGEVIRTGPNSTLTLVLSNGATVMLGADATLGVEAFTQQPFAQAFRVSEIDAEPSTSTTRLNLMRGDLVSDVKKLNKGAGSSFQIKTPVGAAGIRGTAFRLSFRPEGNRANYLLAMAEGTIELVFGSQARPVMVEQNKQVSLSGLQFNPATNEITGLPSVVQVGDVPPATAASLQQLVLQMTSSVGTVAVPSSTTDGTGVQNTTPNQTAPQAQPNAPAAQPVSASPQAQVPATRTSPTDGKPTA